MLLCREPPLAGLPAARLPCHRFFERAARGPSEPDNIRQHRANPAYKLNLSKNAASLYLTSIRYNERLPEKLELELHRNWLRLRKYLFQAAFPIFQAT